MKKQLLSLMLASLIAGSVSCGDTPKAPAEGSDASASTDPAVPETTAYAPEVRDFGGAVFRVIGTNGAMDNFPGGEMTGDAINDTLIERGLAVETAYNIAIEYVVQGSGTCTTTFRNSVLADEKEYDLLVDAGTQIAKITSDGVLADIASLPYLKLDSTHWSRLTAESCRVNGKLWFLCGDIMPVIYTIPSCLYLNTALAADYGVKPDDVFGEVLDGTWTFDSLLALTKDVDRDLNGDGKLDPDHDLVGYLTESGSLPAGLLTVAAGMTLCGSDAAGGLHVDLVNEKTLAFAEKIRPLTSLPHGGGTAFHDVFTSGRALFCQHYTSSSFTRYRGMKDDFAILPIPKYDAEQESYRILMNPWGAAFTAFPSNGDPEKLGLIAEALAFASRRDLRPVVYEQAFKQKGARDDVSAGMLDLIFDNLYLDNNAVYDFGGSVTALSDFYFAGKPLASAYAAIESRIEADIARLTAE